MINLRLQRTPHAASPPREGSIKDGTAATATSPASGRLLVSHDLQPRAKAATRQDPPRKLQPPSRVRQGLPGGHQVASKLQAGVENRLVRASLSLVGVMPHPGDLENRAWRPLPPVLNSRVLSRFDQTLIANHHPEDPNENMCAGLSMRWLDLMRSEHADPRHASGRLSRLASFGSSTHARVIQQLYNAEHRYGMDDATQRNDRPAAVHAGTAALVHAAAMKNLHLQSMLGSEELPFATVVDRHARVDREKLATALKAMASADRGIVVVYMDVGAHAIGFTESTPGKKIVFDPAQGEFLASNGDLPEVIDALASANDNRLMGVDVLKLC